jgi:rfaE bifunctional protein nucleotidyltransferase chain/domain
MITSPKVIPFDDAAKAMDGLRSQGKRIVQCHGSFDLLHPGHMIHLEEAKALGDILVVTVTGEKWINKGPGRPYFNDQLRSKALASLEFVDYVVTIPYAAAVEAIECIRPDIYCKGKEYENPEVDVTGNIHDDVATVERLGGRVAYVGTVVFSSTKLLNRHFETYSPQVTAFCQQLAVSYPQAMLRRHVESFSRLKVLIIGDIIFDRYTTVAVQGLTSKDRILSGRFLDEETQAGGALAVFRHVLEFTPKVRLLSLVGTEPWAEDLLNQFLPPENSDVLRSTRFTTIVKQRFVEPLAEGKQLSKLFSVNHISPQPIGEEIQKSLLNRLDALIHDVDLVMVMDFGHGLMTAPLRRMVEEKAPFLSLNCQTNSNNHGFNIINRQYRRADSFSLDQAEIHLACGRRDCAYADELSRLKQELGARYAWLTRGSVETIGLMEGAPPCTLPPFENQIIDTIGAGDAFTSVASLAAASGLPLDLCTFLGQLAGAQAVKVIGNAEPIRKHRLLKGCEAMLNV